MRKVDAAQIVKVALPVVVACLTVLGVLVSCNRGDPHWLNRAGALIAAVAAGAIIIQIVVEIHLENRRAELEEKARTLRVGLPATPLDALSTRLSAKRIEVHGGELLKQRLTVAAYVVGAAMFGEILHGFGDLWMSRMSNLFEVCASHS